MSVADGIRKREAARKPKPVVVAKPKKAGKLSNKFDGGGLVAGDVVILEPVVDEIAAEEFGGEVHDGG